jgi:predicted O-methyltransferase YrrM
MIVGSYFGLMLSVSSAKGDFFCGPQCVFGQPFETPELLADQSGTGHYNCAASIHNCSEVCKPRPWSRMSMNLFSFLESVGDYVTWQNRFAAVEGFLHDLEGYTLLQLAARGSGLGAIVEIGSFMGRSTAFLAAGSKLAGREKVVAVDHFRGSAEHQQSGTFPNATLAREGTTFNRFQENLTRLGLVDHVQPIQASSLQAVERWRGPVRLLFIDGDHAYKSCRQDFEAWRPFVVPHGFVCFHDVTNFPGVAQFYDELMNSQQEFREVASVVSMKIIERV